MNLPAVGNKSVVGGNECVEDKSFSRVPCKEPREPYEVVTWKCHDNGVAGFVMLAELSYKLSALRKKSASYCMAINDGFSTLLIVPANGGIAGGLLIVETEGKNGVGHKVTLVFPYSRILATPYAHCLYHPDPVSYRAASWVPGCPGLPCHGGAWA